MPQPVFYNNFTNDLMNGVHDMDTDDLRAVLLTSSYTPDPAHATLANLTNQLSTGNGYTQNAKSLTGKSLSTTTGNTTWDFDDIVWAASGGQIGPARYLAIYNSSKSNKLLCYVDFGADRTADNGTNFSVIVDALGALLLNK